MNENQQTPERDPVPVTMCRTTGREVWVWVANAIQIALFVLLTGLGVSYITPFTTGMSILVMCYVTTVILFFFGGLNAFVLVVADYHHAVLINRLFGYKAPKTDIDALTLQKTRTLEEITSGSHAKFFWQGATFIDLRRHAIMGTSITTYSSDQIEQIIKWDGIVGPIPGFLCNLVRIAPSAGHSIVQAKTEGGLCEMVNGLNHKQIIKKQVELKDAFRNLYGGDDTASPFEQGLGLGVRLLTISQINRNKSFQKSAELPARTKKTAEAVETLMEASVDVNGVPTLKAKEALQAVMAESGDAELIIYQGLENMAGGKTILPLGGHRNKTTHGGQNE